MKKYKVTEKHPVYKEGCVIIRTTDIVSDEGRCTYRSYNLVKKGIFMDSILDVPIAENLENGWIKEIQEPELTKNEAIEYAKYCENNIKRVFGITAENTFAASPFYNQWIKDYRND